MKRFLFMLIVACCFQEITTAQTSNESLIAAAMKVDSLFWVAYNQCDLPGMMKYIPRDMEFYHDKGGVTLGDSAFEASIKNGLCTDQSKFRLRRESVPETGRANPMMKNNEVYGVLMTGQHFFYSTREGEKEVKSGMAEYADLWLLRDQQWQLARVFSFDHRAVAEAQPKTGPAVPTSDPQNKPASAGESTAASSGTVAVATATLKEYSGKYLGKNGSITVQQMKGYLTIVSGEVKTDVYPLSTTLFAAKDRDLNFQFAKKGAGIIVVTVKENGKMVDTYTAKKR